MLSIKRMTSLAFMLLLLSTLLVLTTGATYAPVHAAASCYNTGCDGKNPVTVGCDTNVQTIYADVSGDLGGGLTETVSLRYSSACGAAWADVYFNKTLPPNTYGNAIITRNQDSRQYDCTTGDDIVYPTQRSCFSGMVGDAGALSSWAAGMYRTDVPNIPWREVVHTLSF